MSEVIDRETADWERRTLYTRVLGAHRGNLEAAARVLRDTLEFGPVGADALAREVIAAYLGPERAAAELDGAQIGAH